MTNLDTGVSDEVPSDEGTLEATDVGPEDGETGAEAQPEESSYDYLDLDESSGKYVRMTIDGEERSIPLKEALDGYNSNSVATRRFQEASQMRQEADQAIRLANAFRNDPGMTVQILARNAGVSVEQFLGMTPTQQQAASEEQEYVDPLERQVAEQNRMIQEMRAAQEQRDADARLERSIVGLKQQYNIGDDEVRAVVGRALDLQVGPEMFPMIYESMAYQLQRQAQAQHTASQEASAQQRRAAAQAASAVVSTGNGVSTDGQVVAAGTPITSPREAVEAALAELGL